MSDSPVFLGGVFKKQWHVSKIKKDTVQDKPYIKDTIKKNYADKKTPPVYKSMSVSSE